MINPNIHVVILGAGSSLATIPDGGVNGVKPFTLKSFRKDPFFEKFFATLTTECYDMNFENLCDYLYKTDKDKLEELNSLIRQKYSQLVLPQEMSLLEKLILGLNSCDYIVSFNWDSLLLQAYNRVLDYVPEGDLPQLLFPHGNVDAGYKDKRFGCLSNPSNKEYEASPLNMPIDSLDYKDNRFIEDQWNKFDRILVQARMLTFFGYSGPPSDKKDIDHLFHLFDRNPICAKVEIIDKDLETARSIQDKWIKHIWKTEVSADLCDNFYHSRMAMRPKRSIKSLNCWNKIYPDKYSITPDDTYISILSKLKEIQQ